MTQHQNIKHQPLKRGLTAKEAAEYCGIAPSTFFRWVDEELLPRPWPKTRRYDRIAIDAALDKMSKIDPAPKTEYDAWKVKRDRTNAHTAEAHQENRHDAG